MSGNVVCEGLRGRKGEGEGGQKNENELRKAEQYGKVTNAEQKRRDYREEQKNCQGGEFTVLPKKRKANEGI